MRTITHDQEQTIRDWLTAHPTLAVGIGTAEQACSVAAINLALTGELTDRVPDCMSRVIGRWIIGIQDRMPDDVRNGAAWRDLLPLAAGTGRDHEAERSAIAMEWMWGTVLPLIQSVADSGAFGAEWRVMCEQRTAAAANAAAAKAAHAANAAYDANAAYAAYDTAVAVANAANAAYDADAAKSAAYAAANAANAANAYDTAAYAAANAADAAAYAANAAYDADAEAVANAWTTLDPVGLLRRLIAVTDVRAVRP